MSSKNNEVQELIPPDKNQEEVAKKVFSILDDIVKDKVNLGLHKKFSRNYEMVRGKHWKTESKVPMKKANLVYRHIQQTVNQLTDNNPTFNISRSGEGDDKVYTDLQRAATHWWTDQEQQDVLEASVRNGEVYGIAIEKVVFNPDLEYGMGEVETVIVDPYHFGMYPLKITDPRELQKCDAVMHYRPMTVREARRRWPGKEIKPDQMVINELEDERRNINAETGSKPQSMMVSLASVAKEILNWKKGESSDEEELIIVEAWVHDYSTVKTVQKQQVVDPSGGMLEVDVEIESPKYPGNIRYIVACNGKTVLEDRGNPSINLDVLTLEQAQKTYLFDKYPFCAVNSVRDTSSAWGQSDIEQLEELNMEFDKSISQLVLEKDRAVRRKWVNPVTSGVPNDHFTNYTSILNPVDEKAGAAIRVVDYPAIPVDIQNTITMFKDLFFLVSATFELDQAQLGSNQLAYKSIAALIERVATMMRGKIRAYGRLIRERGRMYLSHVMNWYTEDRWITYEDENGIQTAGQINGTQLIIPAKLTVVTGSTLPTSKVQQREEAVNLFQLGAIDQQELLSTMDWSGRSEVIKRMQQGPIGAVMSNLGAVGVPEQLLQFFQQIASMDPKELKKAVKDGEVPPFPEIMKQMIKGMMGQPEQAPQIPATDQAKIQVDAATAQKIMAEINKLAAEQALIIAKIDSERVDQQVKMSGIGFDKEKLTMDKARTVAEITKANKDMKQSDLPKPKNTTATPSPSKPSGDGGAKITVDVKAKPAGYNESGMQSNNQE